MQPTPHHAAYEEALRLIATGTGDEKLHYIAERDPDWFVDHVLRIDYADRDAVLPARNRMDRALLDQAIARLALCPPRTSPTLTSTYLERMAS